jgi:hypothetical protein
MDGLDWHGPDGQQERVVAQPATALRVETPPYGVDACE